MRFEFAPDVFVVLLVALGLIRASWVENDSVPSAPVLLVRGAMALALVALCCLAWGVWLAWDGNGWASLKWAGAGLLLALVFNFLWEVGRGNR